MSVDLLPIGTVAASTGVAISAIRYYEQVGLVTPETRVGGKRRFTPATVGRISFVRRCQDAGFSLDEIRAMLDDTDGAWRDHVEAKIVELEARRDRLDVILDVLREVRACGCRVVADCPRQESLA